MRVYVPRPPDSKVRMLDDTQIAACRKHIGHPEDYYYLELEGTMASGDPYTTLGNTLRSILYTRYYLRSMPNGSWDCLVAGDDVVIFTNDPKGVRRLIMD